MSANSKKTETLVGTFLLIGLGLLGATILLFGNLGDLFKETYQIKVNFSEASGLIEGSTVRLRGAKIGTVAEKPELIDGAKVQVVLKIDSDQRIEEGSVFRVGTASILGDKEIVITPPDRPSEVFLKEGAVVKGGGAGGLERLQDQAESIAEETKEVVREAKTALIKIEESVDEIRKVATQLTTTLDKVNGEVLSSKNLDRVSGSLQNLEEATASFARLGKDLEPAVGDVRETIAEIRETNQVVKRAVQRVEPAFDSIPEVVSSIKRTSKSAQVALEKIQDNKGVIGALVGDEEIKGDVKDFVRNLKEKGILRYKDEESTDDPRERFRGRRR